MTTATDEYRWTDPWPTSDHPLILPKLAEYLKDLPPRAAVIDVGCGNGSLLARFRDRGWKLTGIDVSRSGIEVASTYWRDIAFEVADATGNLNHLGLNAFDAVLCLDVIEHVCLPRKVAENCFKLLKPGGIIIVSTPYHGYLKNLMIALLGRSSRHYDPLWDHGHVKFFSVSTGQRLLIGAGFRDLHWCGIGRAPFLWRDMIFKATVPLQNS